MKAFAASCLLAALALPLAPAARADALTDLKTSLTRLQGLQPVRGQVAWRGEQKQGDEIELQQLQFGVEDGPHGLRLHYPQAALAKAEQEDEAKDQNPKADTPTANALRQLSLRDVRELLRAATTLQRRVDNAQFKGAAPDTWQGQPARKLSFEMRNTRPDKYVKAYSGLLEVWINAEGVPLASRASQTISGRAMVVISFEMRNDDETVYQVSGDRLVATRRTSRNSGSGAGEKGQGSRTLSFTPAAG